MNYYGWEDPDDDDPYADTWAGKGFDKPYGKDD